MKDSRNDLSRVSTGIASLDSLLYGGLPKGEIYVVNGEPGTGKTILGMHFLSAGVQAGERSLCIALSQRVESIRQTAASVGIDASDIMFNELDNAQTLGALASRQTVFDTSELQLEDIMSSLTQVIEAVQPQRVVFDSIAYLRMLASSSLIYRQQLVTLRDYMARRDITILLTDSEEVVPGNNELVAIAHGVITLSQVSTSVGMNYRHLQISKIRGSDYQRGIHNIEISAQGMEIHPLYIHRVDSYQQPDSRQVTSGIPKLDTLLGGGVLTGTSCLILGPSGTGKTSIATLFANRIVQQGGKASVFLFDELSSMFLGRSRDLGIGFNGEENRSRLRIHELGLGNVTPGKLAHLVEQDVINWGAQVVVIDSLTGYLNSMPNVEMLIAQMHELLKALNRQNVLTILVVAQHGVIGPDNDKDVDISYLTDAVLLLRYFEMGGMLRRVISVYKKRYGAHEHGIRELRLTSGKIQLGDPLHQFTGILSGLPNYNGDVKALMDDE